HRAGRISHLDVPGSGPIGRYRLAAPRAPGRPAHLQLDVAHLRVAMKPHVVKGRAAGALHLGPAVELADIRRECGAGVLRLPVQAGGPRSWRFAWYSRCRRAPVAAFRAPIMPPRGALVSVKP